MSTSTLDQKNKRASKITFLVIAEGLRDANFLKYLKSLYSPLNKLNVIIRNGMGGTADGLVQKTINTPGSYDHKATVIDNDKSESEMTKATQLAESNQIQLIKNTPCIEATMLSVLGKKPTEIPNGSSKCKTKYQKEFLNGAKMEDNKILTQVFPKKVLSAKRKTVKLLNEMILLVEGKVKK